MYFSPVSILCLALIVTYDQLFVPIEAEDPTPSPGGATPAPGGAAGASGTAATGGGGNGTSPGGTPAPAPNPCPVNCKKINRFTCTDWTERADGSNNTIWNWNGKYCSLTSERRSWMLSQNCVPFKSQEPRIFWTKEGCKKTCKPCIK